MRYVITKDQFHKIVYRILDEMSANGRVIKEINPYVESGKTYTLHLFNEDEDEFMAYYYYAPYEGDEEDEPHDGVSRLHVDWSVDDKIRKLLSIRKNKVLDVIADWFTEKYNVDVDEVEVYPTKPEY